MRADQVVWTSRWSSRGGIAAARRRQRGGAVQAASCWSSSLTATTWSGLLPGLPSHMTGFTEPTGGEEGGGREEEQDEKKEKGRKKGEKEGKDGVAIVNGEQVGAWLHLSSEWLVASLRIGQ